MTSISDLDSQIISESLALSADENYNWTTENSADFSSTASLFDFEIMSESAQLAQEAVESALHKPAQKEIVATSNVLTAEDASDSESLALSEFAHSLLHRG
ncbi:MAG: hypothetical protein LBI11_03190 [Streptococcaceae bacterium]|jgi:hypothetical protein|nr:hypothetical protein [Streptococcaceae bacterium]